MFEVRKGRGRGIKRMPVRLFQEHMYAMYISIYPDYYDIIERQIFVSHFKSLSLQPCIQQTQITQRE